MTNDNQNICPTLLSDFQRIYKVNGKIFAELAPEEKTLHYDDMMKAFIDCRLEEGTWITEYEKKGLSPTCKDYLDSKLKEIKENSPISLEDFEASYKINDEPYSSLDSWHQSQYKDQMIKAFIDCRLANGYTLSHEEKRLLSSTNLKYLKYRESDLQWENTSTALKIIMIVVGVIVLGLLIYFVAWPVLKIIGVWLGLLSDSWLHTHWLDSPLLNSNESVSLIDIIGFCVCVIYTLGFFVAIIKSFK